MWIDSIFHLALAFAFRLYTGGSLKNSSPAKYKIPNSCLGQFACLRRLCITRQQQQQPITTKQCSPLSATRPPGCLAIWRHRDLWRHKAVLSPGGGHVSTRARALSTRRRGTHDLGLDRVLVDVLEDVWRVDEDADGAPYRHGQEEVELEPVYHHSDVPPILQYLQAQTESLLTQCFKLKKILCCTGAECSQICKGQRLSQISLYKDLRSWAFGKLEIGLRSMFRDFIHCAMGPKLFPPMSKWKAVKILVNFWCTSGTSKPAGCLPRSFIQWAQHANCATKLNRQWSLFLQDKSKKFLSKTIEMHSFAL